MSSVLSSISPTQRRVIAIQQASDSQENAGALGKMKDLAGDGVAAKVGMMVAGPVGIPLAVALKRKFFDSRTPARSPDLPSQLLKVALEQVDLQKLRFPPGHPFAGAVYALHPVKHDTYLPLASFHGTALREKAAELLRLLGALRADTVEIRVERGTARSGGGGIGALLPADVPLKLSASGDACASGSTAVAYSGRFSTRGAPEVPPDLAWFPFEPDWQAVAEARIERGLLEFEVHLHYADALGVSMDIAAQLEDAGFALGGKYERIEEEDWLVRGAFSKKPLFGW